MIEQNSLQLDGTFENLIPVDIFYRTGTTAPWNGSELPWSKEMLSFLGRNGQPRRGGNEPLPTGFLETTVAKIGMLNNFFALVVPTGDELWPQLRREQDSLKSWTVRGVPLPSNYNAGRYYIVGRAVALILCQMHDAEEPLRNLLVPVRDVGQKETLENAFHGFVTGPWLLKGLRDGLPLGK